MVQPRQYVNVEENWTLHDTVLILPPEEIRAPIAGGVIGWFLGWTQLAQATDISFFNQRNRTIGLYWNNQDTRDTAPYAIKLESIGVRFFTTALSQYIAGDGQIVSEKIDNATGHIWVNDLPFHCSATLQIQQDERLKTTCAMIPSGHGIVGDGYGTGQLPISDGELTTLAEASHYDSINQGVPQLSRRWTWPTTIGIPRRANFNVKLIFSEYAKDVIQYLNHGYIKFPDVQQTGKKRWDTISGIQVTLKGKREVQQRGEYHA